MNRLTILLALFLFSTAAAHNQFAVNEWHQQNHLNFKIETATFNNDLEQIVEVINLAYRQQPFSKVNGVRIQLPQLMEILLNPHCKLFFLTSTEGRICGTILLNKSEISMFAIHPHFHGKGYGRYLLSAAEQEAFKDYDVVTLQTIPFLQEKLVAYYESLGYSSSKEKEPLLAGKLERIQEQFHNQVYAITFWKYRP